MSATFLGGARVCQADATEVLFPSGCQRFFRGGRSNFSAVGSLFVLGPSFRVTTLVTYLSALGIRTPVPWTAREFFCLSEKCKFCANLVPRGDVQEWTPKT